MRDHTSIPCIILLCQTSPRFDKWNVVLPVQVVTRLQMRVGGHEPSGDGTATAAAITVLSPSQRVITRRRGGGRRGRVRGRA